MSTPLRSQQRFPFRVPVQLYRNYRKLPPITPPIDDKSQSIVKPIKDIEIPKINAKDFWNQLCEYLAEERSKPYENHGNQQAPNKVVRIFVSSTFTDFFNEREVLIKKVFPALREEMEPRGIQIIDCDLRWGVPKDSTTEQTILACLEELDRCLEENGQPFFIGLIGDKYGWIPKLNELPKHITERYRWIDGASITLMEFIHGAFRHNNPNAFFLIRKSDNIFPNLPEKYLDKFRDKDISSQKQVEQLKNQLSNMISSEQIFTYDCFYNGLDSTSGRERVKIDGLQAFESEAKTFLLNALEKWYPQNFDVGRSFNTDEKQMNTFLVNKTQLYVDRLDESSILMKYITNDHQDFELFKNDKERNNYQPLMALVTPPGFGKTTFLAKFILDIEERMKDKIFLFYYFLDGAFHSNATYFMLDALINKLDKYLNENNIVSRTTNERLQTNNENFILEAIQLISIPIVIIIDGLDKGDIHNERDYYSQFPICSYRSLLSDHTYIILSCENDSKLWKTFLYYNYFQFELKSLTIEQREFYVDKFFQRFNKILEPEQKALLVKNKGCEHPLYLSYICENLRQFGDYSLVTERLKTYPQTIDELLNVLLNEVFTIIEPSILVDAFFKLLLISNVGILESDIVNLLSMFVNRIIDDEKKKIDVNQMTWSILRRNLKTFIDTTWISGRQLITFRHMSLTKKFGERFLNENENEIRSINIFFTQFYEKYKTIEDFSSLRLVYHYDQAEMKKELVQYLRKMDSRFVKRTDRQSYLRKYRCTAHTLGQDGLLNQRAYICNICSAQFRLGPHTPSKSACLICTNLIMGAYTGGAASLNKFEARLCQKHGSKGYPAMTQCVLCKIPIGMTGGKPTGPMNPTIANICMECHLTNKGISRCCSLD